MEEYYVTSTNNSTDSFLPFSFIFFFIQQRVRFKILNERLEFVLFKTRII